MNHKFSGKWITTEEFAALAPRNVFHKQLDKVDLPCDAHRNRHILFRKQFAWDGCGKVMLYISADDYYKLYINGQFAGQGPAPSYHFQYNYNVLDVTEYLCEGENTLAVHTLYQGLINRVWQSGDQRHGLILDLMQDDRLLLCSDESFKAANHTAYTEMGTCGYDTQFLEQYDSRAAEVGFQNPDYDDSQWENAKINRHADHILTEQKSYSLVFEQVLPVKTKKAGQKTFFDFGSCYVGYLVLRAKGKSGDQVTVRCAQELNEDGTVRYQLRANCCYEENWILTDGESTLDWFDYKAFRYAEVLLPEGVEITDAYMQVRHYPFALQAKMKPEYMDDPVLQKIWDLCVHTQKYGVQEVIQDCMDREKGFYLGDGCYTALTNMILIGDDSMVRKLIDDAFATDRITDTLVTCMDCSFMQEIAEYPLILVYLVLWHYRLTGDQVYLQQNYRKITKLLDAYGAQYEQDGLLRNLDKWCVVEWPRNFRHGYDVEIKEGQVCKDAHVSINAYYVEAIRTANKIADILQLPLYREIQPLLDAFCKTFYDADRGLFRDGEHTDHVSLVGNSFPYAFDLCPEERCKENIEDMIRQMGLCSLSFFCAFPVLMGLARYGKADMILDAILEDGTWKRMLREDATTTFEGWGKDCKWNASLFHLTMSYAAVFLADLDTQQLFA